jgi:predicted unusual protein kinase regulating ubiquinone biosynthesis (AarF/ABC1/UbiB family)
MIPNFGVEMATPWIEEFERGLLAEFDFKSEIKNLAIFREIYRDRPDVIIPRPYSKFSNDDVIVMDYVPSQTVTAPFKADRLINLFIEQLLYEGVIHGDLHTGNIGISGNSIVLYDFGNVIRIDPQYKTAIRDFVYGVQTSNVDAIMENMLKMGMTIRDNETARLFVNQYLKYLETLDIKTFSAAELQDKMNAVPVELDSTTLTILRSYTLLEGLAKEVDPELSYERILTKNVETLFLDLEYILYRLEKDSVQK